MTAPTRLALDGGTPCLAAASVATWPSRPGDEVLDALGAVTGPFTEGGPARTIRRLERRWGDLTSRSEVLACRSSIAAARLAAASLELAPGDEIVCPVDAVVAAHAIATACEAVPVFVDLDPETLHVDPVAAEAAVTERTRAILAVDGHGTTADFEALGAIAGRHDLAVIEDGSQALGATYDRLPVGSLGTVSFCGLGHHCTGTAPVAGAFFATDDQTLGANARRVLLVNDDLGLHQPLNGFGAGFGWRYRISEVDAVAADNYLNRLEYEVAVRTANGRHLSRRLSELAGVWTPTVTRRATAVYSSFPLLVQPDELGLPETAAMALRDTLIDCTTAEGLWMDRSQPQPLSSVGFDGGPTPGPGRAGPARPRRAQFPVADAMWASGLVLGGGWSGYAPLQSLQAMDRIADCFAKILVDNVDRLRQLTLERMWTSP